MSIILEHELVLSRYVSDDKMFLEPIIESNQTIPFLESRVLNPEVFSAGILQLNRILLAHPGVNLNAFYDPIVTVTENYVDFEGFARFGHSFCKIRFPEKLFKERIRQEGVTSVDFNPRFIRDLNSRYHTQNLWIYIDPDGVEFAINNTAHSLKKIKMPRWWKDGYRELENYVDLETMAPQFHHKIAEDYNKTILSGKAFQHLIQEIDYSYIVKDDRVRSLFWDEKSVNLHLGGRQKEESTSIKLIKSSDKPSRLWGVWRFRNLVDIADQVIQADVYVANKQPSFWVLHARSGVQLLLGYTQFTNAIWTETARKDIEELLKNPNRGLIEPRPQRRRRRYKKKNKPQSRINFVQMHPGQLIIPDFISN